LNEGRKPNFGVMVLSFGVGYIPGEGNWWAWRNGLVSSSPRWQVLGEDLRLVLGQQQRMAKGRNTWGTPVAYDKLGVRYRRWRNTLQRKAASAQGGSFSASAGEVFALDAPHDDE
jgi:hypothetical protein